MSKTKKTMRGIRKYISRFFEEIVVIVILAIIVPLIIAGMAHVIKTKYDEQAVEVRGYCARFCADEPILEEFCVDEMWRKFEAYERCAEKKEKK